MSTLTVDELVRKKCSPCEGGIPPIPADEAKDLLTQLEGWTLKADGTRITRHWTAKNFMAAIDFFNKVAELAEEDGHHPDLHLEGYRNVSIDLGPTRSAVSPRTTSSWPPRSISFRSR